MTRVALMAACSLVAAAAASALAGGFFREIALGMAAPLLVACLSWLMVERAHRRRPESVTGLLMQAFAVKAVFFAGYVAVVLTRGGVEPRPFVVSFAGFFIALHLTEAVLMRRLFLGR